MAFYDKIISTKSIFLASSGCMHRLFSHFISEVYAFIQSTRKSRDTGVTVPCKGELKVMVLNINAGHNEELMKQCRMLEEYAQYVARVRGYAGSMKLEEAVRRAIRECITEGILTDFLRKNRAEVEMVSILEYDKEYEEKKLRQAEYKAGEQAGLKKGEQAGLKKGEQIGRNRGLAQGIVETGCAFGMPKDMILERLQEKLHISREGALEYFSRFSGQQPVQ